MLVTLLIGWSILIWFDKYFNNSIVIPDLKSIPPCQSENTLINLKISIELRFGLWLGHSITFTLLCLNHLCSFRCTLQLIVSLEKSIFYQVVVILHTESVCPPWFTYILLQSFHPLPACCQWSIPTAWCCHHHASLLRWSVWSDETKI